MAAAPPPTVAGPRAAASDHRRLPCRNLGSYEPSPENS